MLKAGFEPVQTIEHTLLLLENYREVTLLTHVFPLSQMYALRCGIK